AGLWALFEWWRRRRLPPQRLWWWAGAVGGAAAVVAMECGWVVTEVGRQPWVVYRLQTTAAAATTNGGVITSLSLVIIVYAVLGTATILILRMLSRRWRRGALEEAAVPYGPNPAPQDLAAGAAARSWPRMWWDGSASPGSPCTRCWAERTSAAACGTCWPAPPRGGERPGR